MNKPPILTALLAPVLASLLLGTARADTYVPGTQVSYKLSIGSLTGRNTSMVFIDDPADPSGKTYLAFVCEGGNMLVRLYSPVSLGTSGDRVTFFLQPDQGMRRSSTATLRTDRETGRVGVMELARGLSSDTVRFFLAAKQSVSVQVERPRLGRLNFTFPVRGFVQAYGKVSGCDE